MWLWLAKRRWRLLQIEATSHIFEDCSSSPQIMQTWVMPDLTWYSYPNTSCTAILIWLLGLQISLPLIQSFYLISLMANSKDYRLKLYCKNCNNSEHKHLPKPPTPLDLTRSPHVLGSRSHLWWYKLSCLNAPKQQIFVSLTSYWTCISCVP